MQELGQGRVSQDVVDALPPVFGGVQRISGLRSRIDLQPIIALQEQMAAEIGKEKRTDYPKFVTDEDLKATVKAQYGDKIVAALHANNVKKDLQGKSNMARKAMIEKEKILVNYKKEANEECKVPADLD